jgi:hypothetical protein
MQVDLVWVPCEFSFKIHVFMKFLSRLSTKIIDLSLVQRLGSTIELEPIWNSKWKP